MSEELIKLINRAVDHIPEHCLRGRLYHNTDIYRVADIAYHCVMTGEIMDTDLLQSMFADKLQLEGEARAEYLDQHKEIIMQFEDITTSLMHMKDRNQLR